ncbi:MAG: hypothetical protein QF449_04860 [Alphaproteobacteria bacterium]|jgi:hypothetical protein|nr:hypothetical protein [Alphaproteobacteria bacterium]MDP6817354.1 hypothetical protein [Alphaproteobacteria bacterium]|tara:strand:+ start:2240 stop:2422 length:183 start_codon:yes stop_codon:yes gene_type:complete
MQQTQFGGNLEIRKLAVQQGARNVASDARAYEPTGLIRRSKNATIAGGERPGSVGLASRL